MFKNYNIILINNLNYGEKNEELLRWSISIKAN
jgi:hypothetical protein